MNNLQNNKKDIVFGGNVGQGILLLVIFALLKWGEVKENMSLDVKVRVKNWQFKGWVKALIAILVLLMLFNYIIFISGIVPIDTFKATTEEEKSGTTGNKLFSLVPLIAIILLVLFGTNVLRDSSIGTYIIGEKADPRFKRFGRLLAGGVCIYSIFTLTGSLSVVPPPPPPP
jgi:hypothetical protein